MSEEYMRAVATYLAEGQYTRRQIVDMITAKGLTSAENAFWYLNRLWDGGCIIEKMFY